MVLLDEVDKKEAVRRLIEESALTKDYFFLLIISTLITTIGLLVDSQSVVIGGMLLSPLLTPLLALGLAVITNNAESMGRAVVNLGKSMAVILGVSFLTAFFLGVKEPISGEILIRGKVTLPYMYIAILSGVAASYAWINPRISASFPGIAVAIALVPPLCVSGIALSMLSKTIFTGSLQLYLVNVIGIVGSAVVMFSLMGFHDMHEQEKLELTEEKVKLKEQDKKAQEEAVPEKGPGI